MQNISGYLDISYLELWQPFCSEERNHLCNLVENVMRNIFYEIILNLGQWFRRCHLKDFLSEALVALLFSGAEPFMQFFRKRHHREHSCEVI